MRRKTSSIQALRVAALAAALAAASLPALATTRVAPPGRGHGGEEQALRVDLGLLTPRGESRYWDDKALDFTGEAEDFDDLAVRIDYVRFLGPRLGLTVGGSFFEGSLDQAYRDFVDDFGADIVHTTDLELSTLELGLELALAPRGSVIVPYVGAGGGFYAWRLTETGDFIDFGLASPEIFFDRFEDDGVAFGYHLRAGLEVPLSRNTAIYGEGRWQRAEDDLGGDFDGLGELDLSSRTLAAGISWSF